MNSSKPFELIIDASNIQQGGGLHHLIHLLKACSPEKSQFYKVTVFSKKKVLKKLPENTWIEKKTHFLFELPLGARLFWQLFVLPRMLKTDSSSILFSPGGTIPLRSHSPVVVMCQNMLPFEVKESRLFGGWSSMHWKMRVLRWLHGRSFKKANGIIFLSQYARDYILKELSRVSGSNALIPHGIENRFFLAPRAQKPITAYSFKNPFKLLYVSVAMPYKHQIEVAQAVHELRTVQGLPVEITFAGANHGNYSKKLRKTIDALDSSGVFLKWKNEVQFEKLHELYHSSDAFLFASSCENLPNILIEAMASGLPITSSECGPMREVLGNSAIFFNPYQISTISEAILKLVSDPHLRETLSAKSYELAHRYSWPICSQATFDFIAEISGQFNGKKRSHE